MDQDYPVPGIFSPSAAVLIYEFMKLIYESQQHRLMTADYNANTRLASFVKIWILHHWSTKWTAPTYRVRQ